MTRAPFKRHKTRGRKSKHLLPKPLVLVVCEGTETEPRYFRALRRSKRIQRERMRIETGAACGGTNPSFLVEARKLKRKFHQEDGLIYDEVWCVFDHDDHPGFDRALETARRDGVNVAYSVPCFELWYLLHFSDRTAHIERDDVLAELRKPDRLPDYAKSLSGVYVALKPNQGDAIRRAQQLREYHEHNQAKPTTNPVTTVDELVRRLEEMKN
jgi:hypothetical protein